MPARGRSQWTAQAIDSFLSQTYPNKELVIIDDADQPAVLEPQTLHRSITYIRNPERKNIPEKLNQATRVANGRILIRFDSDDYSVPERMADQVATLDGSGKGITGYSTVLFYNPTENQAFRYTSTFPGYAVGTSLCYTRDFWVRNQWPEQVKVASDNDVVREARRAGEIVTSTGFNMIVARVHPDNTSTKSTHKPEYQPVELSELPEGFFN
jgi:glycosyltransferase involved in cell wall biosynthesis